MAVNFHPAPGIILCEEIKEQDTKLTLQVKSKNRTVKAKVLAVGPDLSTDFGSVLSAHEYAKAGQTIFFLSYEGNYDLITIEGKDYYVVKFQDIRGVLK